MKTECLGSDPRKVIWEPTALWETADLTQLCVVCGRILHHPRIFVLIGAGKQHADVDAHGDRTTRLDLAPQNRISRRDLTQLSCS